MTDKTRRSMKKSSKRFTLSSEAKNGHGFRVRTTGVDLANFKANPLMLWMHKRPKGESRNEVLPLGYWDDVEVKGGKITAVPVFDDSDEFALSIYRKVENGTLRMASAGLQPKEFVQLGQDLWLDSCVLSEASIVDIGSNSEALSVALYNENDELVTLSQVYTPNPVKPKQANTMKKVELSAGTLGLLKLADTANEADAHKAILDLVTLADNQKKEIGDLKADRDDLQSKLDDQVALTEEVAIESMLDKAVEARKITAGQKDHYLKLAKADKESVEALLDGIEPAPTVASQIGLAASGSGELMKLSWDELDKQNKLVELREKDPESFKEKYKERFGKEYQG